MRAKKPKKREGKNTQLYIDRAVKIAPGKKPRIMTREHLNGFIITAVTQKEPIKAILLSPATL